jgi:type I restriction-modification system DNA methylase subunit
MGYVYEELLQKFSQDDAKDTGEHFTPREIIKIMVELMGIKFDKELTKSISIYDAIIKFVQNNFGKIFKKISIYSTNYY